MTNLIKSSSLKELSELLKSALIDLPSADNFIAEGFDSELDKYKNLSKGGKEELVRINTEEKEKTEIPSLKIKYNKVIGYFFEVTSANARKIPDYFLHKQTLKNVCRYTTPELSEFDAKIQNAQFQYEKRQEEIRQYLENNILDASPTIQKLAKHIAKADISQSFAFLAKKQRFIAPHITETQDKLEIIEGRHIVIEANLEKESKRFIPNDINMSNNNCFHLITGPNMAGKSTFLRQNALIIYLAHIGSFIPAQSATIPVCDSIFTRIGSGDSLSTGESTFLVEMQEASKILRHATDKSFVILDELGRGTSTYDGLSLAWAITEFLHEKRVKTLFATHYHELINLAKSLPRAKNFSARVLEDKKKGVIFLHQIFEGGAEKSFGIEVARLAGIPQSIITKAEEVLEKLENAEKQKNTSNNAQGRLFEDSLYKEMYEKLLKTQKKQAELKKQNNFSQFEEIKKLDLNNLTPLELFQKISEMQK
ncbi:TPA: DNA mismatch repair protein MutS [Candidatus Peregrinibacteria bacterium]|nr:DNA mismatch repair protein MutS [Candidatus Peregrinibacteria bacterium]HIQ57396.1 DNA mismatch repair protein MutS [Candidatus Gracilibacteria bacterium]